MRIAKAKALTIFLLTLLSVSQANGQYSQSTSPGAVAASRVVPLTIKIALLGFSNTDLNSSYLTSGINSMPVKYQQVLQGPINTCPSPILPEIPDEHRDVSRHMRQRRNRSLSLLQSNINRSRPGSEFDSSLHDRMGWDRENLLHGPLRRYELLDQRASDTGCGRSKRSEPFDGLWQDLGRRVRQRLHLRCRLQLVLSGSALPRHIRPELQVPIIRV